MLTSIFLGGIKSKANESLENKVSNPGIEININYQGESRRKKINYLTSENAFFRENVLEWLEDWGPHDAFLWRESNIPEISPIEHTQIENIFLNIQSSEINSYQSLIEISRNLSENQKLIFANAIAEFIGYHNYTDSNYPVSSQDMFFSTLQHSLYLGNRRVVWGNADIFIPILNSF